MGGVCIAALLLLMTVVVAGPLVVHTIFERSIPLQRRPTIILVNERHAACTILIGLRF